MGYVANLLISKTTFTSLVNKGYIVNGFISESLINLKEYVNILILYDKLQLYIGQPRYRCNIVIEFIQDCYLYTNQYLYS